MTTMSTTRPPMPYNLIHNRSIVAQDIDGGDGAWCPCSLSVVFKPRVSQGMMHLRLKADFMNLNHDEYVYLRLSPEKLVAMEMSDDAAAIPFEIQQHLDDRTPGHIRRGEYLVVTLTLKAPGSVLVPLDYTKLMPSLKSVPQVRAYHSLCRASKLRLFVRKHGLSEAHRDALQSFASLAAAGTLLPVPLDSSRINGARGVSEVDAGVFDVVTSSPSAEADSPPPYSAQHAATGSKRRHDDDDNNERGSVPNESELDFVSAGTPSARKRTREMDAASPSRSTRGDAEAPASGSGGQGEQQPALPPAALTTAQPVPSTLLNTLTPLLTLLTSLPNAATDLQAQIRATAADAMQELRQEADQCLQEMHEEELHALARLRGECHAHWETQRGERQPSRTPTDLRWRTSESGSSNSSSLRARRLRARARTLGVPLSASPPRSTGRRGELTSTEPDTPVVDSSSTPLRGESADPRPTRSAAARNQTSSFVEAHTPAPRPTGTCPRTLHFYFSPRKRQGLSQSPTQADTPTPTPTPETTAATTSIAPPNASEPQAAAAATAPVNMGVAEGQEQEEGGRRGFVLLKEHVGRAQQQVRDRRGVSV
ncbi:hypothetical protein HDK90DRAFT_357222 [Phyllosticta capitalensis]|uniref:Uncharacterized protein n=1 Tax=Phyllosticta capitalensis TaxID=121624 RepID=A0ABR1YII7_9PEZI